MYGIPSEESDEEVMVAVVLTDQRCRPRRHRSRIGAAPSRVRRTSLCPGGDRASAHGHAQGAEGTLREQGVTADTLDLDTAPTAVSAAAMTAHLSEISLTAPRGQTRQRPSGRCHWSPQP